MFACCSSVVRIVIGCSSGVGMLFVRGRGVIWMLLECCLSVPWLLFGYS